MWKNLGSDPVGDQVDLIKQGQIIESYYIILQTHII